MIRKRTIRASGPQLRRLIDDLIDTGFTAHVRIDRYEERGDEVYYVTMPLYLWQSLAETQAAKDLKAVYSPR